MTDPSSFDQILPQMLGPGGALIILLVVGKMAFTFFTNQLAKQEARYDAQEKRQNTLHEKTLEALSAHTIAIERLTDKIDSCEVRKGT